MNKFYVYIFYVLYKLCRLFYLMKMSETSSFKQMSTSKQVSASRQRQTNWYDKEKIHTVDVPSSQSVRAN